jgi:transcription elongation factor Elf1
MQHTCHECGENVCIVHDDRGGEVICGSCGLVLESSVVLESGYISCYRGSLVNYRYNPYNRYVFVGL